MGGFERRLKYDGDSHVRAQSPAVRVRFELTVGHNPTPDFESAQIAGVAPIGTVRIGILSCTAHPLVSTLYYSLQEKFPQVKLVVNNMP